MDSVQAFKEKLTSALLILFHKMETEGTLPNSNYELECYYFAKGVRE